MSIQFKNVIEFSKVFNQTDQFGYIQSEDLPCGTGERLRSQQKLVLI